MWRATCFISHQRAGMTRPVHALRPCSCTSLHRRGPHEAPGILTRCSSCGGYGHAILTSSHLVRGRTDPDCSYAWPEGASRARLGVGGPGWAWPRAHHQQ
ncbi:unnamed protein product [Symbiodinium pilosum]|uniref:Uncharacterized protein n=1 Tax=Symbiodinium pilosum TaxID=2952 RepID=A0A812MP38_SYMPI|nr:unnamed protein product [Symbiodinium pilosum]